MKALEAAIHACTRCKRLRKHCEEIATTKRRAFASEKYWGKPVAGFGDPRAEIMIVGLAPAAHGANRTGRIFTGDRSGEWLYRALYKAGWANQPSSVSRHDGLALRKAYVNCIVRCAPPANKPLPGEILNCRPFLKQEIAELTEIRVFVALGQFALRALWPLLVPLKTPLPSFQHGKEVSLPNDRLLLMSYHPSQQNTFTRKLTEPMFDAIFSKAKKHLTQSP